MSFETPGPLDLDTKDVGEMLVSGLAAFAALLETKGIATMDEVAGCLKVVESRNPAVRWLFDRLAFELQDPDTPILRLVQTGHSNDD